MLEKFSKENKITLVFDEMITGLRTGGSSLQNNYKIKTDLSTFGKAFCGGLPMGIIGLTKK
jgi:glutamate-1-semialdehyde aminotransferase